MSTPLRVSNSLFQEAAVEGSLMNRSTAKQVEFWAELGKRVAHSVTPADLLALMQGIAEVHVEIAESKAINPEQIFTEVEKASASGQLGRKITRNALFYEASITHPGMLDQVMPDGSRRIGSFSNGLFLPE